MAKQETPQAVQITTSELAAALAAALAAQQPKVEEPVKEDDGKLLMKNKQGQMLRCKLTIHRKEKAPDPILYTVGEESFVIKRGHEVTVPWYLVQHMILNIERHYHQEVVDGVRQTFHEDMPAEPFQYSPIDPAEDNPPFQQPRVEA